ncbi:MAG: sulfatase-like hydrolase/transferase, partial [Proteobacteria bacterium]|nr:sulfatase-like hydrolase/transferase [Pseudomonadota bacterium]
AHRIADRSERFLAEQATDRPFLMVASFDEPHHPWTCPPEYLDRFRDFKLEIGPSAFDDLSGKPEHHHRWSEGWLGVQQPTGEYRHPMFLGCNSYVDSQIGRVAEAAQKWSKESGRDTWIIYTSDHGDHIGSHRLMSKGPSGYENNVRIPLIVVPPDGSGAGTVQPSIVSHLDIMPSLLELAGLPVPDTLDGSSLLNLIGSRTRDEERTAVAEYTRYEVGHDGFGGLEPLRMYVKWPWKLVINLHQTDELYHLEEDPHELENRIQDPSAAEPRDRLHQNLLDWMDEHVDPQRGAPWQKREWRDARQDSWKWGAPMRPVPDDGAMPPYLDYDTGLPTRGTAAQFT